MRPFQLTLITGLTLTKLRKGKNFPLFSSWLIADVLKILGVLTPHNNSTGLDPLSVFDMETNRMALFDRSRDGIFCSSC